MSWSAIANTVRSRFETQIATPESLTTQYDNQSLDNPDDKIWCRLTIKFGETELASFGSPSSNRFRTVGTMIAQLFSPIGKGSGELEELADTISNSFKCITQDGVTFIDPDIVNVGEREGMWQINVVCPFYSDDIG
jgi:hypothetical protein